MSIIASLTDGNPRAERGRFFQTTAHWKVAADYEDIKLFRETTENRVAALMDKVRISFKQRDLICKVYLDKLDRAFLDATERPEAYGRGVWECMREIDAILDFLEGSAPRMAVYCEN